MDIDIQFILNKFIEGFILEESKEQAYLELTDSKKRNLFLFKLFREWETIIDMRYLHRLDVSNDTPEVIKKSMYNRGRDLCYIISDHSDIDNKIMEVDFTVDKIYGKGFGYILINLKADQIYLETAEEVNRFIGKKVELK